MRFLLLVFIISFTACSDPDFEKFSELQTLRIVGIVADTPEIDATATSSVSVVLTPYISDIQASGRTFNVTVTGCLDPGIGQGGDVSCNDQVFTYPNSNTFNTSTLSASNYTGAMDPVTISIPTPNTLTSNYSAQRRFNGINYLVYFRLVSGSDQIIAIKAISLSTRSSLNQNPGIENLRLNGNVLTASPKSKGDLSYTTTATGGPENYLEMRTDGSSYSNEEAYLMSWFVTMDSYVNPARTVQDQVSRFGLRDQTVNPTLIGVLRDGRGGTAIRVLQP